MDNEIIPVGGSHKKLWTIFQDIEGYDSLGNLSLPKIMIHLRLSGGPHHKLYYAKISDYSLTGAQQFSS